MHKFYRPWIFIFYSVLSLMPLPAFSDDSVGTHGMVLFSVDGQLVASHMPLHGGQHARQLIMTLESDNNKEIIKLIQSAQRVTLKPETFSLNRLRNGSLNTFRGDVFKGHFERKGKIHLKAIRFRVANKLLDSPLKQQRNGHYRLLNLGQENLLIHEIAAPLSFDQILAVTADSSTPKSINTRSELPISITHWPDSLKEAGITFRQQLYFETQDFQ
ncbi:hypothetical protein ACCI51_17540 [Microbulbifer echini]|uniref:Uncharacterized protein n=1 Tax=Microbulbifer echini TaxID=1529067 RepID=A0ABV4NSF2_9GAMM